MSKRYLRQLVFESTLRVGTIRVCLRCVRCAAAATRRAPSSILLQRAGIAKANSLVDIKLLEHCIRES